MQRNARELWKYENLPYNLNFVILKKDCVYNKDL